MCGAYGGEEGRIQGFGGETRKKETTWETQAKMGGYVMMDLQEVGWGSTDWIKLTQDRDRWLVTVVTNFWVP